MMNISDSIEAYRSMRKYGYTALQKVVDQMIERGVPTDFENNCYHDALGLAEVMFKRSHYHIRILTGDSEGMFLNTLLQPLSEAAIRIQENGGSIFVIVLGDALPDSLRALANVSRCVRVSRASQTGAVRHFIVCDGKMARLEEEHVKLTPFTPADAVKAKVFFNEPEIARVLENKFDSMWNTVQTYSVNRQPVPA